jgi:inner membrane protein
MVTISGVPLFYPFVKNPCVIPGNPKTMSKQITTRKQQRPKN